MTLFRKLSAFGLALALVLPAASAASAKEEEIKFKPLRSEYLDNVHAAVIWDPGTQSVLFKLRNGAEGKVTIGSDQWTVGKHKGKFDAPAKIVDGETYIAKNKEFEKLIKLETASSNRFDTTVQPPANYFTVTADAETEVVVSGEDAADDPAIWIHPTDPAKSTLIATNKGGGVLVYDLDGKELYSYNVGKVNNIDVRYGFPLSGKKVDIVATSNRSDNTITVFTVNPETGELKPAGGKPMQSNMQEVYGFALYHSLKTDKFYGIVVGHEGEFEQWEFYDNGSGGIDGKVVRKFHFGSITEGVVADDEFGYLYIAEENVAIWKYDAEPNGGLLPLARVDSVDGIRLTNDCEGLTIYYGADGKGYLLASSQGSDRYAIYERGEGNRYVTSFGVVDGEIDGTSETDGIDVISFGLGDKYPNGLFLTQDDENITNGEKFNQNFKLVSWDKIANGAPSKLLIEPQDPRKLIWRR